MAKVYVDDFVFEDRSLKILNGSDEVYVSYCPVERAKPYILVVEDGVGSVGIDECEA